MKLAVALLLAHSWYPSDCCGDDVNRDCHPISCAEITYRNEFMYWRGFVFDSYYRRQSADDQCHICIHSEGTEHPSPMCIFTPDAAS